MREYYGAMLDGGTVIGSYMPPGPVLFFFEGDERETEDGGFSNCLSSPRNNCLLQDILTENVFIYTAHSKYLTKYYTILNVE